MSADVHVRDEGTIFLLTPLTEVGEEWMEEHLPEDAQRFAGGVVVEHRFVTDILQGMQADGLSIE
jgi:hypothetical protein